MFRKIVSNLSFSPALVGQLGFYAKRLRKEQTTRRIGLIFVALALVVQCLAVFQPPESANAASDNDLVPGGLGLGANRSINNWLAPYDSNTRNLQDIATTLGITRDEVANAQYSSFITGTVHRSFGHTAKYSQAQGEYPLPIYNAAGVQVTTIYSRPLSIANGPNARIYAWIGHSAKAGWFAVMQACGNLVLDSVPPPPAAGKVVQSKTGVNLSQGNVAASTVAAKENDRISFTVTVKNTGGQAIAATLDDNLEDTLEYATLVDEGGGTFDASTKTLSWPKVTLAPNETQSRTFAIQMAATVPTTPQGQSDSTSYDCIMVNTFGNSITIPVTCAPPKVIEKITTELPHTGPTENMIFAGVVLAAVTFFFLRAQQMNKEVRLIRRDLNAGTI
ncbi:MAG: hypothetical protein JWM52_5 [Candidatus Saccharibacteria bacterium]|nr:hypothetical protein [Candidatus Saccharibacteria bacterium]